MLQKIKDMLSAVEPKILAVISLAPFAFGILVGYVFHGPLSLVFGILKALL